MLWFGVALPWVFARPLPVRWVWVTSAVTFAALLWELLQGTRRSWLAITLGSAVFVAGHAAHVGWVAYWGPLWTSDVVRAVQRDLGSPALLAAYITGITLLSLQAGMIWSRGLQTFKQATSWSAAELEDGRSVPSSASGLLVAVVVWACAIRWLSLGATGAAWW
jgi:hypothetical protein